MTESTTSPGKFLLFETCFVRSSIGTWCKVLNYPFTRFFFAPGCRRIFLAPCVRYRFRLSVYFLCVFRFYGFLSGIIRCYDILPFIFSRFHLWLLQFLSFRPFYVLCYTVQPNAVCQSLFFPFRHIFRLLLFFYQMQISLSVQFFLFTW